MKDFIFLGDDFGFVAKKEIIQIKKEHKGNGTHIFLTNGKEIYLKGQNIKDIIVLMGGEVKIPNTSDLKNIVLSSREGIAGLKEGRRGYEKGTDVYFEYERLIAIEETRIKLIETLYGELVVNMIITGKI